jgi:hypothetical protein
VQIDLTEYKLTITGPRCATHLDGLVSSRRERMCGRFQRSLELPKAVDLERAQAHCHHGTYRIRLPKWHPAERSSSAQPQGADRSAALRRDVIEAVAVGKFHVWVIDTIDEGIELLTGVPAGDRDQEGTFHHRLSQRLQEILSALEKQPVPGPVPRTHLVQPGAPQPSPSPLPGESG